MVDAQTTPATSVDRYWEHFLDQARETGVKDTTVGWHVRHAKTFLKAVSGKRGAGQSRDHMTGDPESAGRIGGIEDRPFRQIVDAFPTLLSTATARVVGAVWVAGPGVLDSTMVKASDRSRATLYTHDARNGSRPDHATNPGAAATRPGEDAARLE
jgi:hypothetical protein